MAANPTTDQILAHLAEVRREVEAACGPAPQGFLDGFDLFARRLTDSLPGMKPSVAGQVLLHVSDLYYEVATNDRTCDISIEALVAVWTLAEAGQRLYLDGERAASHT